MAGYRDLDPRTRALLRQDFRVFRRALRHEPRYTGGDDCTSDRRPSGSGSSVGKPGRRPKNRAGAVVAVCCSCDCFGGTTHREVSALTRIPSLKREKIVSPEKRLLLLEALGQTEAERNHGTRATSVSGRSAEDVKIMVKALLAEKRRRHAERAHTAHGNRSRTTTKVRGERRPLKRSGTTV